MAYFYLQPHEVNSAAIVLGSWKTKKIGKTRSEFKNLFPLFSLLNLTNRHLFLLGSVG